MVKSRCHMCIHRQNWTELFRILLRLTVTQSDLQNLGFTAPSIYVNASKMAFASSERWLVVSAYLDQKLDQTPLFEDYSIMELLALWSQEARQASAETMATILWVLLRKREECPYRICSKLLQQVEEMAILSLFQTRVA